MLCRAGLPCSSSVRCKPAPPLATHPLVTMGSANEPLSAEQRSQLEALKAKKLYSCGHSAAARRLAAGQGRGQHEAWAELQQPDGDAVFDMQPAPAACARAVRPAGRAAAAAG